jgi:hypothetical protein
MVSPCALAHLGRLDDARAAVQAGLALNPTFTLRRFRAGTSSNNPIFLAQRERIYDGMRIAGVPEGRALRDFFRNMGCGIRWLDLRKGSLADIAGGKIHVRFAIKMTRSTASAKAPAAWRC